MWIVCYGGWHIYSRGHENITRAPSELINIYEGWQNCPGWKSTRKQGSVYMARVHLWKSTYNCIAVCIWRVADILEEPWPRCPRLGNWGNADLHLSLPTPVYPQSTPEYPHQSIHTRETKYQSSSSSAATTVVLRYKSIIDYNRVDWTIGWYILRQQIETNPLPNIDTCGATLTPFHAPLHHVNLISFYWN